MPGGDLIDFISGQVVIEEVLEIKGAHVKAKFLAGKLMNNDHQIVIKPSRDRRPAILEHGSAERYASSQERAQHSRTMRWLAIYTLAAYTVFSIFTMTVILFQGFGFHDFELDSAFLNLLGWATIGEIGVLAILVYRFFFESK